MLGYEQWGNRDGTAAELLTAGGLLQVVGELGESAGGISNVVVVDLGRCGSTWIS